MVDPEQKTKTSKVRSLLEINIIHINTEVRVAWRRGLEDAFAQEPREVVPYKLLPVAEESIKQVVSARLRLFNQTQTHVMS
jgi:fructose-bisphosphate aldolase class II